MIIVSEKSDFMTEYENIDHIQIVENRQVTNIMESISANSSTGRCLKCMITPCFDIVAVLKSGKSVIVGQYTTREFAQAAIDMLLHDLDEWEEGDSKYIQIDCEEYFREDCESEEDIENTWNVCMKLPEDAFREAQKHIQNYAKETVRSLADKQDKNPPEPQQAKTYKDDFMAKFPKCKLEEYEICRSDLYSDGECAEKRSANDCYDCWHEPMEES